jgi:hypothetical protein
MLGLTGEREGRGDYAGITLLDEIRGCLFHEIN